jgi:hypothetical protein
MDAKSSGTDLARMEVSDVEEEKRLVNSPVPMVAGTCSMYPTCPPRIDSTAVARLPTAASGFIAIAAESGWRVGAVARSEGCQSLGLRRLCGFWVGVSPPVHDMQTLYTDEACWLTQTSLNFYCFNALTDEGATEM